MRKALSGASRSMLVGRLNICPGLPWTHRLSTRPIRDSEELDRIGHLARADGPLEPGVEGAHPLVRAQPLERPGRLGEAIGQLAGVEPLAQPAPAFPPPLHVL